MTNTTTRQLRGFLPAICLIAALAVSAPGGVAVSPLKQEISVKPGEAGKVHIVLTNNVRKESGAPQTVHLTVMDVQASDDGALDFKDGGVLDNSATRWISLNKAQVTVEPGKSEVIECTVAPPLSAAPGEYYSAVMVAMGTKGQTDKGVIVNYRIASGVFVTVLGRTLPKQARINRCEVVWPGAELVPVAIGPAATTQPVKAELPKLAVVLQNTGQARFDASGKMTVLDEKSRTMFVSTLTSRRACVFGGDSRRFEAFFTRPLPVGKYRIRVEMDYQSSWAKARHEIPVEILPAEAELLVSLKKQLQQESPIAEASPERIVSTLPAGATRSLSLAVHNTGEGTIQCVASLGCADAPGLDSWITLQPAEFMVSRSGRRTVELKVQVPPGAKPGPYASTIKIEGSLDGLTLRKLEIPVNIEVRTEK